MFRVTIELDVYTDDLEMAKLDAIDYFNQISEIKDSEIVEVE